MIQFVFKVTHMTKGESAALRTDKAGGCVWSLLLGPGHGEGLYQSCCALRAQGDS